MNFILETTLYAVLYAILTIWHWYEFNTFNRLLIRILMCLIAIPIGCSFYVRFMLDPVVSALGFIKYLCFKNYYMLFHTDQIWKFAWDRLKYEPVSVIFFLLSCFVAVMVISNLYRCQKRYRLKKSVVYRYATDRFSAEKMRPGSTFEFKVGNPKFQATVYGSADGYDYEALGQCFWVDEGLMTATHVVEDMKYITIERDDVRIELDPSKFVSYIGDLSVYPVDANLLQPLGMSKAKLSKIAVDNDISTTVQVVAMERRSMGFVKPHPQFGHVMYTGSTIGGFSGAPYYVNKTIFGMHLGGDTSANVGYDAAWIRAALRIPAIVNESTADFLLKLVGEGKGREMAWTRDPFNPDEFHVRVNGKYHKLDEEDFFRLDLAADQYYDVRKQRYEVESAARLNKEELPNPPPTLNEELKKEEDPTVAMVRGLLAEFGRSSIVVQEPVPPAEELPPTSRGEAQYVDAPPRAPAAGLTYSGNYLRAPTVPVGAHGMAYAPEVAPRQGMPICPPIQCMSQTVSGPYHMESQKLTRAQPNVVSASTRGLRKKVSQIQRLKKQIEQYSKRYGPIDNGPSTSQVRPTAQPGSNANTSQQ